MLVLLLLASCSGVIAPKRAWFEWDGGQRVSSCSGAGASDSERMGSCGSLFGAIQAAVVAGGLAAASAGAVASCGGGAKLSFAAAPAGKAALRPGRFRMPPNWSAESVRATSSGSSCDECDAGSGSDSESEDAEDASGSGAGSGGSGAGKLWSAAQFPEGCKGPANWDLQNLAAMQDWQCPCKDRNCLSRERYPRVDPLYDYRKTFQTRSKGARDIFRKNILEPRYSKQDGTFTRSCKIGDLNDNCTAAAGLAAGISFATYANARADVTHSRPYHKGRVTALEKLASEQRVHLNAYIRDLRSTMESGKGSDAPNQWHTGKRSAKLRWEDYKRHRTEKGLPTLGSEALFKKLWTSHSEICEYGAIGHPTCDQCGEFQVCAVCCVPCALCRVPCAV